MRKSKATYNARSRELMKMKESMHKATPDSNILNDANALIRLDKRKRMEEEAVSKVYVQGCAKSWIWAWNCLYLL